MGPSTFLPDQLGVIASRAFAPGELLFAITGAVLNQRTRYSFQIGEDQHLDPVEDGAPGFGHYLNHSCDPNAGVRLIDSNGQRYLQVVARRDIRPSEEITIDYAAMELETTVGQVPCRCGASICRGRIHGFGQLPENVRRAYQVEGLIPAFLLALLPNVERNSSGIQPPGRVVPHND